MEKIGGVSKIWEQLQTNEKSGITVSSIESREKHFGGNRKPPSKIKTFWELLYEALNDFTLIILIVCAFISIIVEMLTADPEHRSIAWIEGVAILCAVALSSGITTVNNYQKEQ